MFMPKPPVGVNKWAASPTRKERPLLYVLAVKAWAAQGWVERVSILMLRPKTASIALAGSIDSQCCPSLSIR